MKISELLERQPESKGLWDSGDVEFLSGCYYNHVPELRDLYINHTLSENTAIEVAVFKNHQYDYRPRIWRLLVWYFDDQPVMVTQNAGREGDDHSARFILDVSLYIAMVKYIRTLLPFSSNAEISDDVVDIDEDIPTLTTFYNQNLDGYFESY